MKKYTTFVTVLFAASLFSFACFSPEPSGEKSELVNIYEGPISTFQESCSGCHGENGADYEEDFKTLTDDDLSKKIHSMYAGPANIMAPQEEDIEAMIQYHRALRDGKPFLMVSNPVAFVGGFDKTLKGSVTPGAQIELHREGDIVKIAEREGEWTLDNAPQPPFKLLAKKDGVETSFSFPEKQWN